MKPAKSTSSQISAMRSPSIRQNVVCVNETAAPRGSISRNGAPVCVPLNVTRSQTRSSSATCMSTLAERSGKHAIHHPQKLWLYVGAIVALGFVSAGLMSARRLISGRQALDVEMDMRQGLYSHFVRLSFGFYDRNQTGQLMSRATVDLQGVRFFLGYGLIFFFQNILTVVSVTAVLFLYEWKLAVVALGLTPLLALLSYRYRKVAHPD